MDNMPLHEHCKTAWKNTRLRNNVVFIVDSWLWG